MSKIFISLLLLGSLIILTRKKKLNSIVYIYSMWSFIVLIDYYFYQKSFVPYSEKFDLIFFYFTFITLFSYLLFRTIGKYTFYRLVIKKNIIFFEYKTLVLISYIAAFFSILLFLNAFRTMSFLEIRESISSETLSLKVGISFPLMCSLIYYKYIYKLKKNIKVDIFFIFLLAVISSSKIFIILAIFYTVPWYIKGYTVSIKLIVSVVLIGFLGFFALHFFTGRVAGKSENLLYNLLFTLNGYLIGGLAVFQQFLDNNLQILDDGWIKTGDWIGNVRGALYFYYADYNIFLLTFKAMSIGTIFTIVSFNSKLTNFLKIYSIYPLLFIYFGDLFFSSIIQWSVFIFAGILVLFTREPSITIKQ